MADGDKSFFGGFKKFSDLLGKITTISGLLLIPFFGMAANAQMIANPASSNTDILTSFWRGLFSDPFTREWDFAAGAGGILNGWGLLLTSMFNVAADAVAMASGLPPPQLWPQLLEPPPHPSCQNWQTALYRS